jgi:hypothetical protein
VLILCFTFLFLPLFLWCFNVSITASLCGPRRHNTTFARWEECSAQVTYLEEALKNAGLEIKALTSEHKQQTQSWSDSLRKHECVCACVRVCGTLSSVFV